MAATDADQPRTPSVPGGDAVLSVQRICLDFQSRAEMYRPRFLDFLQKHRTELGLTDVEDLAGAYLHSVWPPDLPSNLIIANASFDRFGRWIIRPPMRCGQARRATQETCLALAAISLID